MSSKNPERFIFHENRNSYANIMNGLAPSLPKPFIRDSRGWILFGPQDVRSSKSKYRFGLQKLPKQKTPRVRVGCRYYTLREAWVHWGLRKSDYSRRNECRQAVAIIRLMLLQAQAYGLLSLYAATPKFDSTILKRKRP